MSERVKTLVLPIILLFIIVGVFLLNYFHTDLEQYLTDVPFYGYIIPLLSILAAVLIGYFLWNREQEFSDLKYEFLTIITHKFRTPLTSMRWLMDELQKENIPVVEKKELIQNATLTIDKLMEVVDNLAGVVRSDKRLEYSFDVVSVRKMLDTSLQKLSQLIDERKIQFEITKGEGIPYIRADEQKIQFVIDTVLENAIRYTPQKGNIYITLYEKNNKVVLAIQDTGIGLTRKDQKKIFQKFFRSDSARNMDPEGLGIALHLAKVIMEGHGGNIRVESEGLNKGSIFYLELRIPS